MQQFPRFILSWLAILLVLAGLAGCGGSNTAVTGEAGPLSVVSPSAPPLFPSPSPGGPTVSPPSSPTPTPTNSGSIRLLFDLQQARQIPAEVLTFRFTGLNYAGTSIYGPVTVAKAPEVLLNDVPLEVVVLQIEYLRDSTLVGLSTLNVVWADDLTSAPTLQKAEFTAVYPEFTDVDTLIDFSLAPSNVTMLVGAAYPMAALATFADGTTYNLAASSHWTSGNPAVASVSNVGVCSGVSSGNTSVLAVFGDHSAGAAVSVDRGGVASLQVAPASASFEVPQSQSFSATVTYTTGGTEDVTSRATWTSSLPNVATVDASGRATARQVGNTTITARFENVAGTADLQVSRVFDLISLTIEPSEPIVNLYGTIQLRATGRFLNGQTRDVTNEVAWSSQDPSTATVLPDGSVKGLTAINGESTTVVTAAAGSVVANCTVRVLDRGVPPAPTPVPNPLDRLMEILSRADGPNGAVKQAIRPTSVSSYSSVRRQLSANGRYAVFLSSQPGLPGANGYVQCYRRDRETGATVIVSSHNGVSSGYDVTDVALSPNGQYVAFVCRSDFGGVFSSENTSMVFMRNLSGATLRLVSCRAGQATTRCSAGLLQDENAVAFNPSISDPAGGAGPFVAYQYIRESLLSAPNVATSGPDGLQLVNNVYRADMSQTPAPTCVLVNRTSGGGSPLQSAYAPAISSVGQFVAFTSASSQLVAGTGGPSNLQAWVRDMNAGSTRLASPQTGTTLTRSNRDCTRACVSANGLFVGYQTDPGSNVIVGGVTGTGSQFVRASLSSSPPTQLQITSYNAGCSDLFLADDGQSAAFTTTATNVLPGVTGRQVYRRRIEAGSTLLISGTGPVAGPFTPGNASSRHCGLTADGTRAAFFSVATNLFTPPPGFEALYSVFLGP